MHEFKTLWMSLSYITQEFGDALGYSYICHLLVYFVQQVLAVYGFLSAMDGFSTTKMGFVVSVVMFTYAIFMICSCAHRATDQASRSHNHLYPLFKDQYSKDLHCNGLLYSSWQYSTSLALFTSLGCVSPENPQLSFATAGKHFESLMRRGFGGGITLPIISFPSFSLPEVLCHSTYELILVVWGFFFIRRNLTKF